METHSLAHGNTQKPLKDHYPEKVGGSWKLSRVTQALGVDPVHPVWIGVETGFPILQMGKHLACSSPLLLG